MALSVTIKKGEAISELVRERKYPTYKRVPKPPGAVGRSNFRLEPMNSVGVSVPLPQERPTPAAIRGSSGLQMQGSQWELPLTQR